MQPGAGHRSSGPRRIVVRLAVIVAVLAWIGGAVFGMERLWAYKSTPGASAVAPAQWPGSAHITPIRGQATLVMFAHPLCSCTRASLAELDSIMQRSGGRVSAWVLFLHPEGASDEWANSSTWSAARHVRNAHVVLDHDGTEAARFGAATSGQVVLYDAHGKLQFSGGITGARGHVGDNSGEERVVDLVNTGTADAHDHAVYGCELYDPHPRTDSDDNT